MQFTKLVRHTIRHAAAAAFAAKEKCLANKNIQKYKAYQQKKLKKNKNVDSKAHTYSIATKIKKRQKKKPKNCL